MIAGPLEKLLTKLERRFGRYAFGNITYGLVIAQAIGFALVLVRPDLAHRLVLDRAALFDGEWWRLVTFLLSPVSKSPIFVVFALFWLYTMGRALEEQWGSFRYELYWIVGVVLTVVAVLVGGSAATVGPLIMSLFLAFATLWPDYTLRLFFILPVPVKWLALLDGIGLAAWIALAPGLDKLVPLAAASSYLLFFGPTLVALVVGFFKEGGRARARARFRHAQKEGAAAVPAERRCKVCGKGSDDRSVDLRVCSCEVCGGVDTWFCVDHARNHRPA